MDGYQEHDGVGLAALVARGEVTATELLDASLARARRLNPLLNAITVMAEEAGRSAIAEGLPDGPMTGVPFLLKDLGAEAVALPTTSGSNLYKGTVHTYDSEIYLRLKAAGLVAFGRTASPEFGIGPVTEAGANGAPTRNPWNTAHTSGGSSGGAAAAVAAGIVAVAHGSDGGGSVRIPASSCGLVGFKPTRARLPDGPGAGEGWAGMAIDGFLTRSLRDTAVLLDATAGPDLGAPYWPPPMAEGFAAAMNRDPGPLKIAYLTTSFSGDAVHGDCRKAIENTAAALEGLGHHVDEFRGTIEIRPMMRAWTNIVACGTALAVFARSKEPSAYEPKLDGVTRGAVRMAAGLSGADYLQSVSVVHAFGRQMAGQMADIDVLLTPTLAEPPAKVGRFRPDNEDFLDYRTGPDGVFAYSPFTAAFNASGQPALSLPLHWTDDDLPVGVHLAARFGDDALLMSLAAQLETAMPWRDKQLSLIRKLDT
ncbi:MAG: amidase [Rhodospirillales bacterium]|nr:MAG: amidase [Rhodospirillales bacterium]